MLYQRYLLEKVSRALRNNPAVLLLGPRQIGKTTLVRHIADEQKIAYISLDDIRILPSVRQDALTFLEQNHQPLIIDEVQRAPELFLPIKQIIDANRTAGAFLLTGSANPLLAPKIADSLAGRMQLLHLWPLSQGELRNKQEHFLSFIFKNAETFASPRLEPLTREHLLKLLVTGGYPTMQTLSEQQDRDDWCNSYLTTILQRDVQDLAHIEGLAVLPNLLKIFATRIAGLLNNAEVSRASSLPTATLNRYTVLLESLFMVYRQPAWSENLSKRLVKAPKLYFVDTGIAAYLLNANTERLKHEPKIVGQLFENFVANELAKQITWHTERISQYHFRTPAGAEVDIVLENSMGSIVGIEVKSAQTISSDDFKGLKELASLAGKKFIRGVVLYAGNVAVPFGKDLWALPVNSLWEV